MKTTFVAINANFYHTSLSAALLVPTVEECSLVETHINRPIFETVQKIYDSLPDIVAFSCYIFNIEYIKKVISDLKQLLPNICFIGGGQEVNLNRAHDCLFDYVIIGEGDLTFADLIVKIKNGKTPTKTNPPQIIKGKTVDNINNIHRPNNVEFLTENNTKLVYYESMRGCPFNCAYCGSAGGGAVRMLDLDKVFADINDFAQAKCRVVKFVDRTFNCDIARAKNIWRYIANLNTDTVFHFEAKPELFDAEAIEILATIPYGRIQLEIGIQSDYAPTLNAINRSVNRDRASDNIKSILANGNVHVHLDLIAGLLYEDLPQLKESLEYVYSLRPHHIQLGILKILEGTPISKVDGYTYSTYPPYEILSSPSLTFEEVKIAKNFARLIERYYNSKRFCKSIEYITKNISFAEFLVALSPLSNLDDSKLDSLYEAMLKLNPNDNILRELLIYDYLCSDRSYNIPRCLNPNYNKMPNKGIEGHLKRSYMLGIDVDTLEKKECLYDFWYEKKDYISGTFLSKKRI